MKQGWEIKKFEELIQENQIGLIKSTKEQGNDKPYRYLKMDSITSDNNLIHDRYVYVDADKSELEKYTLNEGDFLFNTRNSYELVGKTCVFTPIDDEPTLFNNNIMKVVFKKNISSRFINYAFSSELVKERLQKLKSGTTSVVGIYYNGLRNLEIPLPPLPEQQRIVSILDETFAAIAKAKANAEENLKNAKELFESYLQGVFENKGEGWEEKRFEELIQENQIGLIKSTKEQGNDKPYRYLKMDSITSDNNLIHDRYVYVDADKSELEKFTLNEGDFLFNTRNSYELVGKTCVFSPIDDEPTLFNNNIMRVVFKNDISSRFINYAFSSELVKERLQKLKSGTTSVVGIYYKGLRNLKIPVTKYKEQQTIVRQLDALRAETQKLEAVYQKKIDDLEELKKSILQKAFSGQLSESRIMAD